VPFIKQQVGVTADWEAVDVMTKSTPWLAT